MAASTESSDLVVDMFLMNRCRSTRLVAVSCQSLAQCCEADFGAYGTKDSNGSVMPVSVLLVSSEPAVRRGRPDS